MRSEKLLLLERARRLRYRAIICRDLAGLTEKKHPVSVLHGLAREFEAEASRLERKARAVPPVRILSTGVMSAGCDERPAPQEPLAAPDRDDPDKPK